ncbi:MAG: bifunctional UDP-N-acetylglucosamine diphosphorylase/glucosamine-1-phosphate N-acetyltransferase GlmU [Desulfovibrionaceae bacterium]|nr:bifunctional UDP-N-acetylglucosamine diphosphorylase/glucosamine-1-phosphate N-acetyltransferase GlmU [Desulfovibrionaceae bacterium]
MIDRKTGVGALILAAGKGTRMHSDKPKVLQSLLGEPMLSHVYAALYNLFGEAIWAVVGFHSSQVRDAFQGSPLHFIEQKQQLGTGHAVLCALPDLEKAGIETLLVVNGDTPLVTENIFEHILQQAGEADFCVATLDLDDPGSFGRIVRKNGQPAAIIEAKDYDERLFGPASGEINAGIYVLRLSTMSSLLEKLTNDNRSGEFYLTDLLAMAIEAGLTIRGISCGKNLDLLGVNSPSELAEAEKRRKKQRVDEMLQKGVLIHGDDVAIGPFVDIAPGAEIYSPCELYGKTCIQSGAIIASHCRIRQSHIASGARIESFCWLENAQIGANCTVGPYARLRPGAVMEDESHIGNFVELKQARLGRGVKANHLTYLGDADIGSCTNIGAGTIICNYDGVTKHKTHIGEHAFIGSNTALVAPVSLGKNVLIGAGSVITKDVPDDTLAVTRPVLRTCRRKKA